VWRKRSFCKSLSKQEENRLALPAGHYATNSNFRKTRGMDSKTSLEQHSSIVIDETVTQSAVKIGLENLIPGPVDLPSELPPGITAIFLTSSTQELFKLKGGEHVSAEKPLKFVPKSDILADLYARAAVSDFSPIKALIQVRISVNIIYRNFQRRRSCFIMMLISSMDKTF